jgi:hypothetical protein
LGFRNVIISVLMQLKAAMPTNSCLCVGIGVYKGTAPSHVRGTAWSFSLLPRVTSNYAVLSSSFVPTPPHQPHPATSSLCRPRPPLRPTVRNPPTLPNCNLDCEALSTTWCAWRCPHRRAPHLAQPQIRHCRRPRPPTLGLTPTVSRHTGTRRTHPLGHGHEDEKEGVLVWARPTRHEKLGGQFLSLIVMSH